MRSDTSTRLHVPHEAAILSTVLILSLCVRVYGINFALPEYYFNPEDQKPQMREAARALLEQFRSGDIVLHTSDSSALAFQYYAPDLPDHFLAGDPDYTTETTRGRTGRLAGLVPEDWNVVIAGYSRIWVVVALDHNVEYQHARVAALDEVLRYISTETIEGIYLVLFQAKSPAR